jgi:hypothetical protein
MKSRRLRWAGHVALWERGEVHTEFWWKRHEGRRPFGRPRHRWEDNIKSGIRLWTGLVWLTTGTGGGWAFVNAVMNFHVP